jgi:hypothetical protein
LRGRAKSFRSTFSLWRAASARGCRDRTRSRWRTQSTSPRPDLSDPPKIDADPHRISRASNPLGNAIKFTPEVGPSHLRAAARRALSVTIADTDAGSLRKISRTYSIAIGDPGIGRRGNGLGPTWRGMWGHGGPWAESSPQGATFVHVAARTRRDERSRRDDTVGSRRVFGTRRATRRGDTSDEMDQSKPLLAAIVEDEAGMSAGRRSGSASPAPHRRSS